MESDNSQLEQLLKKYDPRVVDLMDHVAKHDDRLKDALSFAADNNSIPRGLLSFLDELDHLRVIDDALPDLPNYKPITTLYNRFVRNGAISPVLLTTWTGQLAAPFLEKNSVDVIDSLLPVDFRVKPEDFSAALSAYSASDSSKDTLRNQEVTLAGTYGYLLQSQKGGWLGDVDILIAQCAQYASVIKSKIWKGDRDDTFFDVWKTRTLNRRVQHFGLPVDKTKNQSSPEVAAQVVRAAAYSTVGDDADLILEAFNRNYFTDDRIIELALDSIHPDRFDAAIGKEIPTLHDLYRKPISGRLPSFSEKDKAVAWESVDDATFSDEEWEKSDGLPVDDDYSEWGPLSKSDDAWACESDEIPGGVISAYDNDQPAIGANINDSSLSSGNTVTATGGSTMSDNKKPTDPHNPNQKPTPQPNEPPRMPNSGAISGSFPQPRIPEISPLTPAEGVPAADVDAHLNIDGHSHASKEEAADIDYFADTVGDEGLPPMDAFPEDGSAGNITDAVSTDSVDEAAAPAPSFGPDPLGDMLADKDDTVKDPFSDRELPASDDGSDMFAGTGEGPQAAAGSPDFDPFATANRVDDPFGEPAQLAKLEGFDEDEGDSVYIPNDAPAAVTVDPEIQVEEANIPNVGNTTIQFGGGASYQSASDEVVEEHFPSAESLDDLPTPSSVHNTIGAPESTIEDHVTPAAPVEIPRVQSSEPAASDESLESVPLPDSADTYGGLNLGPEEEGAEAITEVGDRPVVAEDVETSELVTDDYETKELPAPLSVGSTTSDGSDTLSVDDVALGIHNAMISSGKHTNLNDVKAYVAENTADAVEHLDVLNDNPNEEAIAQIYGTLKPSAAETSEESVVPGIKRSYARVAISAGLLTAIGIIGGVVGTNLPPAGNNDDNSSYVANADNDNQPQTIAYEDNSNNANENASANVANDNSNNGSQTQPATNVGGPDVPTPGPDGGSGTEPEPLTREQAIEAIVEVYSSESIKPVIEAGVDDAMGTGTLEDYVTTVTDNFEELKDELVQYAVESADSVSDVLALASAYAEHSTKSTDSQEEHGFLTEVLAGKGYDAWVADTLSDENLSEKQRTLLEQELTEADTMSRLNFMFMSDNEYAQWQQELFDSIEPTPVEPTPIERAYNSVVQTFEAAGVTVEGLQELMNSDSAAEIASAVHVAYSAVLASDAEGKDSARDALAAYVVALDTDLPFVVDGEETTLDVMAEGMDSRAVLRAVDVFYNALNSDVFNQDDVSTYDRRGDDATILRKPEGTYIPDTYSIMIANSYESLVQKFSSVGINNVDLNSRLATLQDSNSQGEIVTTIREAYNELTSISPEERDALAYSVAIDSLVDYAIDLRTDVNFIVDGEETTLDVMAEGMDSRAVLRAVDVFYNALNSDVFNQDDASTHDRRGDDATILRKPEGTYIPNVKSD